jgi:lipopolysaccharide transport protein LptA
VLLDKNAKVDGVESAISADRISMQFDQNFDNLQSAATSGNCYFQTFEIAKNGQKQGKEIIADRIKMTYDPQGRPQQITVRGAGKIIVAGQKNNGQIESDAIEISLRSETQTLEKVMCLTRGILSNRGQDNIVVSGDSVLALYAKDGVLVECKAEKNCEFNTDDFRGTAAAINYDAANFLIHITGKDAAIISKKNIFNSSRFLIHTKSRQLDSDKGVKATIVPEKKNVLLSSKPLFITAAGMEMTDKGNVFRFKDKVKLFQDDIELHAKEMLFDSRKNRMSFTGNADLKFINENEAVVLRGQTIFFNTSERKIIVAGDARLNQAENILNGRQIELSFSLKNQLETIQAMGNVTFAKKDLSGKSGLLHWYFNKKSILFENSAQITRKGAGTTKGRELLLNLSTNEIKVSSREDRAETIIKQDIP